MKTDRKRAKMIKRMSTFIPPECIRDEWSQCDIDWVAEGLLELAAHNAAGRVVVGYFFGISEPEYATIASGKSAAKVRGGDHSEYRGMIPEIILILAGHAAEFKFFGVGWNWDEVMSTLGTSPTEETLRSGSDLEKAALLASKIADSKPSFKEHLECSVDIACEITDELWHVIRSVAQLLIEHGTVHFDMFDEICRPLWRGVDSHPEWAKLLNDPELEENGVGPQGGMTSCP